MPRRRGATHPPLEFLADPAIGFLDGELVSDAPAEVRVAHELARNVAAAMEGRALIVVCEQAGLNRSTVQSLLAGRGFCDIVTVAKLESTLGVDLWPRRA